MIVIANVPQGLPATVVSLLTVVARRLAVKQIFVKRLDCIETLGSTTTIASDKTGTLTQNRMTVTGIWSESEFFSSHLFDEFRQKLRRSRAAGAASANITAVRTSSVSGNMRRSRSISMARGPSVFTRRSSVDRIRSSMERRSDADVNPQFLEPVDPINGVQHLYLVACVCNRAKFEGDEPPVDWSSSNTIQERANTLSLTGSPSEIALLRWCEQTMPSRPTRNAHKIVFEIPFSSTTKVHLMVTTNANRAGPPPSRTSQVDYKVLLKGAPERILVRCTTYWIHGEEIPIDDLFRKTFDAAYNRFGSGGQRVLGFAFRSFQAPPVIPGVFEFAADDEQHHGPNYPSDNLCFVGLCAITDPPRENVPEAVHKCQTAGIRVAMVTGDHILTACAIARQVNILPPDSSHELPEVSACVALREYFQKKKGFLLFSRQIMPSFFLEKKLAHTHTHTHAYLTKTHSCIGR